MHYQRWRNGRDFAAPGDLRFREPRTCSVECCERPAKSRGWCGTHYARWRIKGDPGTAPAAPAHRSTSSTYVRIWAPGHPLAHGDGYVLEHRKVWFDAHGDIPPGHHIHHKDHDKMNNVVENLERLTASEHQAQHVQSGMSIRNQYGSFLVGKGA